MPARNDLLRLIQLSLTSCIFAASALAAPANLAPPKDRPLTLGAVLSRIHIVEGKAIRFKHRPDLSGKGPDSKVGVVTFQITRVVCGDGVNVNDEFSVLAGDLGDDIPMLGDHRTLNLPRPIPKIGEVGLWQVHEAGGLLIGNFDDHARKPDVGTLPVAGQYLLPFPGHEGTYDPSLAAHATKVAEAFRSIAAAPDEAARVGRLTTAIRDADPYVAVSTIWLLNKATGMTGRAKLARELLLDEHVVLPARLLLDMVLTAGADWEGPLDPQWTTSRQRDHILPSFAEIARERNDCELVASWLGNSSGGNHLTMNQCLAVYRQAMKNDRFVAAMGKSLANYVQFANDVRSAADRDAAFEFFRDLLATSKNRNVRYAAAVALIWIGWRDYPLTDAQLNELRAFRKVEADQETAAELDKSLSVAAKKRAGTFDGTP